MRYGAYPVFDQLADDDDAVSVSPITAARVDTMPATTFVGQISIPSSQVSPETGASPVEIIDDTVQRGAEGITNAMVAAGATPQQATNWTPWVIAGAVYFLFFR